MDLVTCPHCGTTVFPTPEGGCPACRRDLAAPPEPKPAPAQDAWDEYRASLHEPPAEAGPGSPAPEAGAAASPPAGGRQAAAKARAIAVKRFEAALAAFTPVAWVTPALVGLCIAAYGAEIVRTNTVLPPPGELVSLGANFGPKTLAGQYWRLLSYAFLHFNPPHLLFNLWALWGVGRLLERLCGNAGFLLLYLASAVAGGLASLAWNPEVVSAGASGAVFGTCGGLAGFLARRKDTVPPDVLKHLRGSVVSFVLVNALLGATASGIDHACHAGGLAGGFLCGLVLSQPLDARTRGRRLVRNAVTAAVAAAGLAAAVPLLPAAPPDADAEFRKIAEVEERVLADYRRLVARAQAGTIGDAEVAAELRADLIPPWREIADRAEDLAGAGTVNREVARAVAAALRARQESLEALEAAASGDEAQMARHREKWEEADRLVARIPTIANTEP